MVPGRFAPNPVRPLSRFAPIIAIKWGESTHFSGRIDSLSGAKRPEPEANRSAGRNDPDSKIL